MASVTQLGKTVSNFRNEVVTRLAQLMKNQEKIIEQNEQILSALNAQQAKRTRTPKSNAD